MKTAAMYKLFAFILFLFFSVISFAQTPTQTLKGRVTDEANGEPLPFAIIQLVGTQPLRGAETNDDGFFRIDSLPVGRYDIEITMTGYEKVLQREVTLVSGKETNLEIRLQHVAHVLSSVTVQGQNNKENALNTYSTVSSRQISMEEARRYAGGYDDPARLASSFAGVSGNVGNNGISVRGNAPNGILWRLEGVEIPNPSHFADVISFGAGGVTALSSQMLANSDFLTGAFAPEYGNGTAGVFDLNLRPGNRDKREYTLQAGLIGLDASTEGPFVKGKAASYLFNYRYSTMALLTPILPEGAEGTSYQDLSFNIVFPAKKAGTFNFWGLGGLNTSGQAAKMDSVRWQYASDRQESQVDQFFGSVGIGHKVLLGKKSTLKTTLAATGNGLDWNDQYLTAELKLQPAQTIKQFSGKVNLSSTLNYAVRNNLSVRAGVILNQLFFNLQFDQTVNGQTFDVVNRNGTAFWLQGFAQMRWQPAPKWTIVGGLHNQWFSVTQRYSAEPRASVQWQALPRHRFSFAYGLHTRLEPLYLYQAQKEVNGETVQPNRSLDWARSNHFVLGYEWSLNENCRLKAEPYLQYLIGLPVAATGSYALINEKSNWFLNDSLFNNGVGRNVGIDITFERFMRKGYYYLITASVFDSRYQGADGVWRQTRYNRQYIVNATGGYEWRLGKKKQHQLGVNLRLTLQGGEKSTPIDQTASAQAGMVVEELAQAWTAQVPAAYFLAHLTINYSAHRPKTTHTLSIQAVNAAAAQEFQGYRFNYVDRKVDESWDRIVVPNLAYKIQF